MTVVLDASALLALLRAEAGGTKIAAVIDQARMSAVNYAEVVSYYAKLDAAQSDIDAMLLPLPVEIIAVDRDLATIAGMLRPLTLAAGLSLGDRCCLALAKRGVHSIPTKRAQPSNLLRRGFCPPTPHANSD